MYSSFLCQEEKKNAVSRTLVNLFMRNQNNPITINELSELYSNAKDGIQKRKENIQTNDKTSSVRTYIAIWNNIAKKNKLGLHENNKNGCISKNVYHRVCKKRIGKIGMHYWINYDLAKCIYSDDIPSAKRTKNVNKNFSRNIQEKPIFQLSKFSKKLDLSFNKNFVSNMPISIHNIFPVTPDTDLDLIVNNFEKIFGDFPTPMFYNFE